MRLDRRLEEVAEAVGGGSCRLQMRLKLALAVRETVAGHRLAPRRGGGGLPRPLPMLPFPPPPAWKGKALVRATVGVASTTFRVLELCVSFFFWRSLKTKVFL